jgi:DNA-binding IclR family transcriptional regulator
MPEEEGPAPALLEHMTNVYNAMKSKAIDVELDSENGKEVLEIIKVYEGHLTGLFAELGMSTPYYTSIMKALKAMGCVDQVRRGGGAALSKWQLNYPPTAEGYAAYENNRVPNRRQGEIAALKQQVRDLHGRLAAIESILQRVEA